MMMVRSFLDAIIASRLVMLLFAYLVLEPIDNFPLFASQYSLCQEIFTETAFNLKIG